MIPKFRGFRTRTEEWVEGNLIYREEPYLHDIVIPVGDSGTISYAVERDSVGQWTGLKDVNGEDIFEGDIVEIKQQGSIDNYIPNNSVNEIVYKDSAFCVKETWGIGGIEWPIIAGLYYKVSEEFEVLGNIYENPELLEVAEC